MKRYSRLTVVERWFQFLDSDSKDKRNELNVLKRARVVTEVCVL